MHANQFVLRCYAKRTNEGKWSAVCIDLNIDAEADSIHRRQSFVGTCDYRVSRNRH